MVMSGISVGACWALRLAGLAARLVTKAKVTGIRKGRLRNILLNMEPPQARRNWLAMYSVQHFLAIVLLNPPTCERRIGAHYSMNRAQHLREGRVLPTIEVQSKPL